ncbi:MAG TPA: phage/plasmid primase, P4 family [Bryobacteraceae bacterium]|nr:phage/plasmid primase, P4 family [Bryobacteraceae bacterium]
MKDVSSPRKRKTADAPAVPPSPLPDAGESDGSEIVTAVPKQLPHRTDAGNAELFRSLYSDKVRFDHKRKRWLIWRGERWSEDGDGTIRRFAKKAIRARLQIANSILSDEELQKEVKWSFKSESRAKLDAMLELAKAERPIADSGEGWDSDPWLLGVPNGVVDLRTGKLLPGAPARRMTMQTRVPYDPKANAPRWDRFLREVFENDNDLIDFVQKAVGYSTTGITQEQVFFSLYGPGSDGKTTLMEALRDALGDYGFNMPFSTLELAARTGIPNDVAALVNRRFVTASETNEASRWNEARVKVLTGEDNVTARFLYQEFFNFRPVGKFWVGFNHRPTVSDDSFGFWRRVRLIPFRHRFEGEEQDKKLIEALRAEAPGILRWAVEGCLKWQEEGLGMPPAVQEATEDYRATADIVGQFLEDACVVDEDRSISAGTLWAEFERWCEENGERLDRRAFADRLENKGFRKARTGHDRQRMWVGLTLKTMAEAEGLAA